MVHGVHRHHFLEKVDEEISVILISASPAHRCDHSNYSRSAGTFLMQENSSRVHQMQKVWSLHLIAIQRSRRHKSVLIYTGAPENNLYKLNWLTRC